MIKVFLFSILLIINYSFANIQNCDDAFVSKDLKELDSFILTAQDSSCVDKLLVKREAMVDQLVKSARVNLFDRKHKDYDREGAGTVVVDLALGALAGTAFYVGSEIGGVPQYSLWALGAVALVFPITMTLKYFAEGAETETEEKERKLWEKCIEKRECY